MRKTIFVMSMSALLLSPMWVSAQQTETQSLTTTQTTIGVPRSAAWSLSDSDWAKYEELMQGAAGVWYRGKSPIQVLATAQDVSASDLARYAAIAAKMNSKRQKAELRWQIAYDKAIENNAAEIQQDWNEIKLDSRPTADSATTILVVLDIGCRESCANQVAKVNRRAENPDLVTHVYLEGATTESQIIQWATDHRIDIEATKQRRVTLNFSNNILAKVGFAATKPPLVLINDNGAYFAEDS